MRKIIVSEMLSLDGYFAGPNGEIDWHHVDEDFNSQAIDLLKTVDTILFGRITYDLFKGYWPTADKDQSSSKTNNEIAAMINASDKIVFSKTIGEPGWKNVKIVREIIPEEITKLKQKPGKDIIVYGSGTVVSELARQGLVDEYLLIVNPVVLGSGKPLFKDLKDRIGMKLLKSREFKNGNVAMFYQPI